MYRTTLLLLSLLFLGGRPLVDQPPAASPWPVVFEANLGQADADADFLVNAPGCTVHLAASNATLRPHDGGRELRMDIVGADSAAAGTGEAALPGHSNYYRGNDPSKWVTGVRHYERVRYTDIYAGIDLVYHGSQQQLEYDFVVEPGVDPSAIALRFDGADGVALDHGDVVIRMGDAEVRQHAPVVYQQHGGRREYVEAHYRVGDDGTLSFSIGAYDGGRELVIDPVITFSTFYGGSAYDDCFSVAVDASGNIVMVGGTASTDLPGIAPDAYQPASAGGPLGSGWRRRNEGYLLKLGKDGQTILWATYLGGSGLDALTDVAVDANGDIVVVGATDSADFPTLNAVPSGPGGARDGFLAKFDGSGALLLSAVVGGSADDYIGSVAVDEAGAIYVTGDTQSPDFPTVAAIFDSPRGAAGRDVFVAKYSSQGVPVYSTYYGSPGLDVSFMIAVDDDGNAHVVGYTSNTGGFPLVNAFTPPGGGQDTFVAKFNAAGSALVYSAMVGGSAGEAGLAVGIDSEGNAIYTAQTASTDFPSLNPIQSVHGGGYDLAVFKLDPSGSLLFSTFLGGTGFDGGGPGGVVFDSADRPHIVASSNSTDLSLVDPIQPVSGGGHDLVLYRLDKTCSTVEFSTLFGGNADDVSLRPAVLHDGSVILGAITSSNDFPTVHALQADYGGGSSDAAVAKLEFDQDGDGLPDLWEEHGFTAADGTFVNLPAMGAKVDRKDIFVEIDYMTGHKPVDLQAVIDAFAAAPVDTDGIKLHIMIDDEIPFTDPLGGTAPSGKYEWSGTDENKTYFQDIKDHPVYGLTPSLKKVAHYCVFADTIVFGDGTLSGISREAEQGEVAGSDFIVSLGAIGHGGVGSMIQQRGTFMHELGHNLGLRHGGDDGTKGKPNYLSVMNYFFQLEGLVCDGTDGCLDFSSQKLADLNENALDETVGIGAAAGLGTKAENSLFYDPDTKTSVRTIDDASGAIDWNNDGDKTDTDLVFDLNGDNLPIEGAVPGSIFTGFNDWESLVFKGGSIGAPGASAPPPQPETTEPPEEIDQEIFASLGPPAPEGLKGHSADPQTTLTWKPGANVTYNIYRTQAGDIEFLGNTTQSNYHDKSAADGVEYVYSVASVNETGTEGPSTSVTVVAR